FHGCCGVAVRNLYGATESVLHSRRSGCGNGRRQHQPLCPRPGPVHRTESIHHHHAQQTHHRQGRRTVRCNNGRARREQARGDEIDRTTTSLHRNVCEHRTEAETTASRACNAVIFSLEERSLLVWSYRQLVALRAASREPVKFFCASWPISRKIVGCFRRRSANRKPKSPRHRMSASSKPFVGCC